MFSFGVSIAFDTILINNNVKINDTRVPGKYQQPLQQAETAY